MVRSFALILGCGLQTVKLQRAIIVTYEGDGLLVVQLDPNGPAAQAGLVEGDTIAQIDGKDITTLLELKEQIDIFMTSLSKSHRQIFILRYWLFHAGKRNCKMH